jgi:putative ABC transport system permease protein
LQPLERVVDEALRQERITAVLIAGFSIGALLLAAMGIYGVVAGSVTRRRREIAVRMALGAHHDRVLREVVRDGAVLVLFGMLLGVPGVFLSGRVIQGVLVGVSPFDPLTLIIVTISLGLVALAACYVPAHRVTRIEPARLLRLD